MVFSSILFLCFFLPVVLSMYALMPRWRNGLLLAASLFFYAWGEASFLPVLVASLWFNYLIALSLRSRHSRLGKLSLGISVNIALLCVFKYAAFFNANLSRLLGFQIPGMWRFSLERLPLGISFFTFQAMSYLIDVYRGDTPPERRFTRVALYISMFPQLVAGPIVRFKDIAAELQSRQLTVASAAKGVRVFTIGLASKVLLANTLAVVADAAFDTRVEILSPALAWFGVLSYSLQIYFDFAGYSTMAIGLGLILGFTFPQNFNFPYAARSITEFWRRWHMSLSTWFRDYLYIPMGGNQGRKSRTYFNLVCVFLLCGLWHGANWTFVAWGVFHGCFLIAERWARDRKLVLSGIIARIYTLAAVGGGWILFRCYDLHHAAGYLKAIVGVAGNGAPQRTASEYLSPEAIMALVLGLLFSGAFGTLPLTCDDLMGEGTPLGLRWTRSLALSALLVLCLATLAAGTYNPFIYFNF